MTAAQNAYATKSFAQKVAGRTFAAKTLAVLAIAAAGVAAAGSDAHAGGHRAHPYAASYGYGSHSSYAPRYGRYAPHRQVVVVERPVIVEKPVIVERTIVVERPVVVGHTPHHAARRVSTRIGDYRWRRDH